MTKNLAIGEIYSVEITDYSHEGLGIGHLEDCTIFVKNGLKGETCQVKILSNNKGIYKGQAISIENDNPARKRPACKEFSQCGGCDFQHVKYLDQLQIKRETVINTLKKVGGISNADLLVEKVMSSPKTTNYRNKGSFRVGKIRNKLVIRHFEENSHTLVKTPCNYLYSEGIEKVVKELEYILPALECKVQEGKYLGLYQIVIRESAKTGKIAIVFVTTGLFVQDFPKLVDNVRRISPKIAFIGIHKSAREIHGFFTRPVETLWGNRQLLEELDGVKYLLSPESFFQVNTAQAVRMYSLVKEMAALTGKENVVDLYCGIGSITLFLADQCKSIIGIESVSKAVEDARENAKLNGISNAKFIYGRAENELPALVKKGLEADVIVLDPPRKGAEMEVLESIVKTSPKKIIYVSCNPATLARDLRFLKESYNIERICPVDMFPQTGHVESVVLLRKLETKHHVNIDYQVDMSDITKSENKATYDEIKAYILRKYDLKVSTLYISQVKRKCGLEVGEAYNKPKSKDTKQPQCPQEKEKAIVDALKYFQMI